MKLFAFSNYFHFVQNSKLEWILVSTVDLEVTKTVMTMIVKTGYFQETKDDDVKMDQDLDFFLDEVLETYPNKLLHNDPFGQSVCT